MQRFLRQLLVYIILVPYSLFLLPHSTYGYSSLRQSDWSQGYGQQVWSDPTKFNEYYHLKYQTPGELTIDTSNDNRDNWYDKGWKYRRQIKFNNQENGELSHFPILVKLVHKDNFNYDKVHSQGNDLRFTDSDGTTILPHDIEKWEETGTSFIWVKVPNIKASSSDDYIYMYYGKPDAIDTKNPAGVFDNKFILVYHFQQTPRNGVVYSDSSTKGYDGTIVDSENRIIEAAGMVGNAFESTGTQVSVEAQDNADLEFGTDIDFTLEGWVNLKGSGTQRVFEKRVSNQGWNFFYNNSTGYLLQLDSGGTGACQVSSNRKLNYEGWHHIVGVVYRRSSCTANDIIIYIDGKRESTTVTDSSNNTNASLAGDEAFRLGRTRASSNASFTGAMDEIRISHTARDPSWVKASYETVTGDLQSYGHEETLGGELLSSIFDAGHGPNWGYLSYDADEPDKTAAKVKVRTGNDMYLADAPDFEVCDSITNKSDISTNNCVTDGHRYIQYQVILDTQEAGKTPIFKSISITDFLPHPVVKGISTVASPSPSPNTSYIILNTFPSPAPRPSASPALQDPSLTPNPYPLTTLLSPVIDFLNALFH